MSTVSIGASTGLPVSQDGAPAATPASASAPHTVKEPASGDEPPKPYYDFDVSMTCGACSGAVTRVLQKIIVEPCHFDVSLPTQRVKVWGPEGSLPPFEEVEAKIAKTGKKINEKRHVKAE